MKALSFMVVLFFKTPSSSMSCNGSNTFSIPSILCSPKYKRLASSNASCHISCQSIATRISSSDTSFACRQEPTYNFFILITRKGKKNRKFEIKVINHFTCSTSTPLCCRTFSTTSSAAALRKLLIDLQATRRGYIRACERNPDTVILCGREKNKMKGIYTNDMTGNTTVECNQSQTIRGNLRKDFPFVQIQKLTIQTLITQSQMCNSTTYIDK